MTVVIVAEVAVAPGHELRAAAEDLVGELVRRMGTDATRHLDAAVARRSENPTLTADEVTRLGAARALVAVSLTGT